MTQDFPLQPGGVLTTVQLSLCAGGLVRTWADDGSSRLWSVAAAEWLHSVQGTGVIGRTSHAERRFREVGLISDGGNALSINGRFPKETDDGSYKLEAQLLEVKPAGEPSESVYEDVRALLTQAIVNSLTSNEYLIVERGGWDAPPEPFCLFVVVADEQGPVNVIETAPAPHGSEIWDPHIVAGQPSVTLTAPASRDTVEVAPLIVLEAISRWGLEPWDLALTFGKF